MNREIKFRAWLDDESQMLYSNNNSINHEYVQLEWFYSRLGKMATVMQYTGLKDEDRVEIYEGDLVQFLSGRILAVEWNDDICQYQFSDGSPINNGDNYSSWKLVIGNIYENPELIN